MFIVAAELGMTVRELGARMGADELLEWMAFFRIRAHPGPAKTDDEIINEALARKAARELPSPTRTTDPHWPSYQV